jgi:hypothetical protein
MRAASSLENPNCTSAQAMALAAPTMNGIEPESEAAAAFSKQKALLAVNDRRPSSDPSW